MTPNTIVRAHLTEHRKLRQLLESAATHFRGEALRAPDDEGLYAALAMVEECDAALTLLGALRPDDKGVNRLLQAYEASLIEGGYHFQARRLQDFLSRTTC